MISIMLRSLVFGAVVAFFLAGCSQVRDNVASVNEAKCGTCHGYPPADKLGADSIAVHKVSDHQTFISQCGLCHAGYADGSVNTATHGDSVVEPIIRSATCAGCHPGTGTGCALCHGLPTDSGTHAKSDHAGFIRQCGLCHIGYDSATVVRATHPNNAVDTSTALRGANVLCQPCHAGSGGGGCATCHQSPPDSGTHKLAVHSGVKTKCGYCHAGYDSTTANAVTHRNGTVDTSTAQRLTTPVCQTCHTNTGLNCAGCHKAPPDSGTHKLTVHAGIKTKCGFCHAGYDSTTLNAVTHRNGTVDTSTAQRLANPLCQTCHKSTGLSCAACHKAPPDTGTHAVKYHTDLVKRCGFCHTGYDSTTANTATHRNGKVDTSSATRATNVLCQGCHTNSGGSNCGKCHEYRPTGEPHPVHLTTMKYNCNVCHPGGADTTGPAASGTFHRNKTVDVKITYPFTITPAQVNTATWTEATQTCASVYCHGTFTGGNGTGTVTTTASVTCGGCHTLPANSATHLVPDHITAGVLQNCSNCHAGYSGTSTATYKVNTAQHVNGTVNTTRTVQQSNAVCIDCHG